MAMMIEQRAQFLQSLGSIATSAADIAAEGIAEAVKTNSKAVDTALKLFGGFDRSEFENFNAQSPNLLTPAVRPPASYEAPAEYFKPISTTMEGQSLLVPAKDLLQQLEDPRFRMADGLSGFSDNRITKTLMQKEMMINSKPDGDVSLGGLNEKGIIVVDGGKPADPADIAASLDSFGKLFVMEDTVRKQLQLHEQLDLGAMRFAASKPAPLSTVDNPRLDQGLKGLPDAQAATATPSKEILNLTLDHALNATPKTVGEMAQMAIVLQKEIMKIYEAAEILGLVEPLNDAYYRLQSLKDACELFPPDMPPNQLLLEFFAGTRSDLKQISFFPS